MILTILLAAGPAAQAQETDAPELRWTPCPIEGFDDLRVECSTVTMPVSREAPSGRNIDVAVGRLRATDPARSEEGGRIQLWYLPGGPGDSGIEALGRLAEVFVDTGVDLYTLDHRGVGNTALLRCPDQEAEDSPEGREVAREEWADCLAWLDANRDDLEYLTTTESAHDLGDLVRVASDPLDRIVVFGASYGTYWANRYLLLYPEQPDAVILDGIVPPDWTFAEFDASLDATGRKLLGECVLNADCSAHLGADPIAMAAALPDKFDAGHCADLGIDGATVRLIAGNMLMAGPDVWPYIPATLFRLDRCRIRDLQAIGALVENLFEDGGRGVEPESHSPVLQRHVALSELWPADAPDAATFETALRRTIMTTEVSASFARTAADWPRYPRPSDDGLLSSYSGPLLLLHGGIDPTMPVERLSALRDHYQGPNQQFVFFPDSGHVTLNGNPCARSIYGAFIAAPSAPVDTSCVADAPQLDLSPPEQDSLFGTDDFWGERTTWLEIGVLAVNFAIVVLGATLAIWLGRVIRRRRARAAA